MKRTFDALLALVGLALLWPLLLAIGILVKLTSAGPILFKQWRVGRDGRDFRIWKFRTMAVVKDADRGRFDAGDRSRVTALGRWLRRFKLDELPQLWNVLKGEMSLVGPRPEVRKWVEAYPERWAIVLRERPGVTDPASILYRNEEELLTKADDPETYYRTVILPRKLDLYERYVKTRSLAGDARIVIETMLTLLGIRKEAAL